jgi:saccharopine dehydrogenase (NAD+, L-lysine-forming)
MNYPSVTPYPNEFELIDYTKKRLEVARMINLLPKGLYNTIVDEKIGRFPKIMIIGALGRCGSGAVDFATFAGIPV